MADPLSVSASIASLITITESVFNRAFKYAKAVKGAPDVVRNLASSIGALSGILHNLFPVARQLEGETFDTSIQISHISSCRRTMDRMQEILEKYDPSSNGGQMEKIKRLKWPFSASEAKTLTTEMEQHKSTLSLALSVDGLSSFLQALSGQKHLQSSVNDMKVELMQQREDKERNHLCQERRTILNWIQPYDPQQHHSKSLALRHPETGLWLIESAEVGRGLRISSSFMTREFLLNASKRAQSVNYKVLIQVEESAKAQVFTSFNSG